MSIVNAITQSRRGQATTVGADYTAERDRHLSQRVRFLTAQGGMMEQGRSRDFDQDYTDR